MIKRLLFIIIIITITLIAFSSPNSPIDINSISIPKDSSVVVINREVTNSYSMTRDFWKANCQIFGKCDYVCTVDGTEYYLLN